MKGRLFTFAVSVSLLGCIASAGLWVTSVVKPRGMTWDRAMGSEEVSVSRGHVYAERVRYATPRPWPSHFYFHQPHQSPTSGGVGVRGARQVAWFRGGFGYESDTARRDASRRTVLLPIWVLCLAAAWLPGWWVVRYRRGRVTARRAAEGRCPACGYDLRASAGRCPECGAAVGPDSPASSRGGWSRREVALMAAPGLLVLGLAAWLTPPRPACANSGKPWTWELYYYDPAWAGAGGTGTNRMFCRDAWGGIAFQTIWQRGDEQFLVVVGRQAENGAFASPVYVFDRSMNLVRSGAIGLEWSAQRFPYCLVEARSTDSNSPAYFRDEWSLFVGVVAANYTPTSPLRIDPPPPPYPQWPYQHVVPYLVNWEKDREQQRANWELARRRDAPVAWQTRWAEPGAPP